jgi:hypothetical protein
MKVCIITLHRVKNYGSVLQAYATQVFFNDAGYETEFIDYYRENDTDTYAEKNLGQNIVNRLVNAKVHRRFHSILSNIVKKMLVPSMKINNYIFNSFVSNRLKCTEIKYFSYKELVDAVPNADAFCVGSDQVWNSIYNGGILPTYYLDFVQPEKIKFSFASSIGMDNLFETEQDEVQKKLLTFNFVSVREQSAIKMLKDIGITAKRIIDPTLLLPVNKWELLLNKSNIKYRYILVYTFGISKDAEKCIKQISNTLNLKVVRIGTQPYHKLKSGKVIINPSIEEYLTLFYYADYVITNSFHGTAFSVTFNKNFTVLLRDNFNYRILDFLELVNLQNRVYQGSDNSVCQQKINYKEVNLILDHERMLSRKYIDKVLGKINEND